jgi:hypothetical protein
MTQALYAHMNNKKKKKSRKGAWEILCLARQLFPSNKSMLRKRNQTSGRQLPFSATLLNDMPREI